MRKISVLCVSNRVLPDGDYRLAYGDRSNICSMSYAFPEKPNSLDGRQYVRVGFGEGFKISYLYHLVPFAAYLRMTRQKLDLVLFNTTVLILFGSMIARIVGVPSITTVTGLGRTFNNKKRKYRMLKPLYMFLMSVSFRLSNRILFQNHGDLRTITAKFPGLARKFAYIGSAVSVPVVREKNFNEPNLSVLLVARLIPDKGIEDFLQVAEQLHKSGFSFVLVGPVSYGYERLAEKVRAYHSKGVIDYKGILNGRETYSQFVRSHIFLFPSYGEGMARVMLEAGFAQMCPIAYDIPANRDLIAEGRGYLLKCGNVDKVVQILVNLYSYRNLLKENAILYQKWVTSYFNIEAYSQRMDKILSDVSREIGGGDN